MAAAHLDGDGLDAALQVVPGNILFVFHPRQDPAFIEAGHDDVSILGGVVNDAGHDFLGFPEHGPQVRVEGNVHALAMGPHHQRINRFPARFRQGKGNPRDVQVVDAGPVDTGEVCRLEVGKGRMLADIGYLRVPFQDLFLHLEARHMVVIGPDIIVMDIIGLEEVADALPKGIDADLGNIRHIVAQTSHTDGIIQFCPADMAGKMFHFFQRPHFFSNQQAHGLADCKHFTHGLPPIVPLFYQSCPHRRRPSSKRGPGS